MPPLKSNPQDPFAFLKGRSLFADKDGDGYYDHVEPAWSVSGGSPANNCGSREMIFMLAFAWEIE